ncbi:MAG: hypothetical protein QOE73_2302 [Verrucomicrobiota bacterium]
MTSPARAIAGIFIFTTSVVIVATALMYWLGNDALRTHAREQSRRAAILNLDWIVSILKDAEIDQRGYLLTGDEAHLQSFKETAKQLANAIATIRDAEQLGISHDKLQAIVRLVQAKLTELRAAVDLRRNRDVDAAKGFIKADKETKAMDKLRATVGGLEKEQLEKLQDDSRSTDNSIRLRTLVFLLAGCGNILFLGWAYHRISHAMEEREAAAVMDT